MTCALCDRVEAARASDRSGRPVYDDDVAVVLVDGDPARRRQAWVIPKAHYRALEELDEPTGVHLLKLGMRAALSLGASADDELQVLLEGSAAEVDAHVHVRVRPRALARGA